MPDAKPNLPRITCSFDAEERRKLTKLKHKLEKDTKLNVSYAELMRKAVACLFDKHGIK